MQAKIYSTDLLDFYSLPGIVAIVEGDDSTTCGSFARLMQILSENHKLAGIFRTSSSESEVLERVRDWVTGFLPAGSKAHAYYSGDSPGSAALRDLTGRDIAAIRLLDYIDYAGLVLSDQNLAGKKVESNPIGLVWQATRKGSDVASADFFEDMVQLFKQLNGEYEPPPSRSKLENWMDRHPSGTQPEVVWQRTANRTRILNHIIDEIENGTKRDPKYRFEEGLTRDQKMSIAMQWWKEHRFHLRFAARNPEDLSKMLNGSLDPKTMAVLKKAEAKGIPFFVNPYYLSLLQTEADAHGQIVDHAIRDYVIYTSQLVEAFGEISAWEKEDIVEPGKPNAAGWLTPAQNIHRRYPEVAILIPDTMGRACGGLCSVCQRMYGFQKGNLSFNLEKLAPKKSWHAKLKDLMDYFETDSQLRDVLITGGDALMSSNTSLKSILEAVYEMAKRKKERNRFRKPDQKHAEITRIRLGTRLPVYLPQRVTTELLEILSAFKKKAAAIGMKQFVIQTHFVSPLEITPESRRAIQDLLSTGWLVTNQMVFTAASSRRGYAARLRQELNKIGVLPYYTFSVKGFRENSHHYATTARMVQEQVEEKRFGTVFNGSKGLISELAQRPDALKNCLSELGRSLNQPFLSTDRSVVNLPGVGKSMTFRVVGLTRSGRRVLRFDHDGTRKHSPIIKQLGQVMLIESKSIAAYVRQLQEMGENPDDYEGIFGYSISETEPRMPIYDYPEADFQITDQLTNIVTMNHSPSTKES